MRFQFNDGGRSAAGFRGETGDCVTRSIAIATGKRYREVYDAMWSGIRDSARVKKGSSPRSGVSRKVYQKYLESLGWKWTPTMAIGQGCKVHLRDGELPNGRLIVRVSKHVVAVIDGVIHDTYDEQRDDTRCVYGYYSQGSQEIMSESPGSYENKAAVYIENIHLP